MASTRKSKGVNNRFANFIEVPSRKDAGNSSNSRQRKRKISDMLGSQWSKGEIERFYDAYRKFGKDWKKVANAVRNRSNEMVEALYNMNPAYLSLPEGTATVAGLIAMMTDHYNVLEESENGGEGNKAPGSSKKLKKRGRGKVRHNMSKDDSVQSLSFASSDGCLSLLKSRPSDGWAVGKRTPRVPVSYKKDDTEIYAFPRKRVANANDDDDVAHVAALALTQASLRGSLQAWQPSYRLSDNLKLSPSQDKERMHGRSKNFIEDSLGRKGGENGDFVRGSSSLMDIRQTKKKDYGKKIKAEDVDNNEFVDSPEACSGTEGLSLSSLKGILDAEMAKADFVQIKRSKKLRLAEESSAFEALLTLADMSLMMPTSAIEHDSSIPVKEDKADPDKSSVGEAVSSSYPGDKRKVLGATDKSVHGYSGFEVTSSNALPKEKLLSNCPNKGSKRKRKPSASKEEKTLQVPTTTEAKLPAHQRSRRKKNLPSSWTLKSLKSPKKVIKQRNQLSHQDEALCLKEMLSSLSSYMLRRWCYFEWFYCSIDYPWFAKNEFVEYLYHVGLGHIRWLTRVEWGVIRSSLGKPRRFSNQFLNGERNKLKQYRESVRTHYAELRAGIKDGLPADLARPLTVGQQVIALHPKTREINDGRILTVDYDRCRVQFDRLEMGVEFVKDIDCMPRNPLENMPEALSRQCIAANKFYMESKELKSNGQSNNEMPIAFNSKDGPNVSSTNHPINTIMKQIQGGTIHSSQAKTEAIDIVNSQQVAYNEPFGQFQSKEAISETTQSRNKKVQLRERDTQTGQSMPPWLKSQAVSNDFVGPTNSVDNHVFISQEQASNVHEIVKGSRIKAHAMVDAAIQALSLAKEGEDAFTKIKEALYSMNGCQSTSGTGPSVQDNGSTKSNELQIPSGLITSTVAALLSIQMCTEREYPPADVAHVLDSAVKSLNPSCSQNLSIHRDIQMCMGKLKTQILALIPT